MRRSGATPSPVYWAGASLKRHAGEERRGTAAGAFPGLLGRGLIEASSRACASAATCPPSPVYWAGASLKPKPPARRSRTHGRLPRSTGPGPH